MRGKQPLCWLAILSLLVLTGCWDAKELEKTVFVNAIGIDYRQGKYTAYVQVISFPNLAKKESGFQQEPDQIWVGRGYGSTLDSATDNIYPVAHSDLSWGHVKAIVLSEAAVKHGAFTEMLDVIERYSEIRVELYMSVTKRPVEEILDARPILNLSALYTQLNNPYQIYKQYSIVAPVTLREFITDLYEPSKTLLLPYLNVSKKRWKLNKRALSVIQTDGAAILKNGKFKGEMSDADLAGERWVDKQTKRIKIYLYEKGKPVASVSIANPTSKKNIQLHNGTPHYSVEVKAKGSINEMLKTKTKQELEKMLADKIKNQILHSFKIGLKKGADVLQLEDTLYQKDPSLWHQLAKEKKLKPNEQSLDVKVKVSLSSTGRLKILTGSK